MSNKKDDSSIQAISSVIIFFVFVYLAIGIFWSFAAANVFFAVLGILLIAGIIYAVILIRKKRAEAQAEFESIVQQPSNELLCDTKKTNPSSTKFNLTVEIGGKVYEQATIEMSDDSASIVSTNGKATEFHRENRNNYYERTKSDYSAVETKPKKRKSKSYSAARKDELKNSFSSTLQNLPKANIVLSEIPVQRQQLETMPTIRRTYIKKDTDTRSLFPLVIIDVETTGLNPEKDDIIEVSAIKYESCFTPMCCYTTLLKPNCAISERAAEINGISNEMVENCPRFFEVQQGFYDFISGCNIVGHNIAFDLKFLFCSGMPFPKKIKIYDTYRISKQILCESNDMYYSEEDERWKDVAEYDVNNYKLPTLCDYYKIYRNEEHRSLSDCLATGKVFEHLVADVIAGKDKSNGIRGIPV